MELQIDTFTNIFILMEKIHEYKNNIMQSLDKNNIISLYDIKDEILPSLYLENVQEFKDKIPMLKKQINQFVTYEKAFIELISENQILPIQSTHHVGALHVYIKSHDNVYENNKITIPVIPFETFIKIYTK